MTMKKEIKIKGMDCAHCVMAVESALHSIAGVKAKVNLKKGIAAVQTDRDIADDVFKTKISEAGYEVVSITEKKGLW